MDAGCRQLGLADKAFSRYVSIQDKGARWQSTRPSARRGEIQVFPFAVRPPSRWVWKDRRCRGIATCECGMVYTKPAVRRNLGFSDARDFHRILLLLPAEFKAHGWHETVPMAVSRSDVGALLPSGCTLPRVGISNGAQPNPVYDLRLPAADIPVVTSSRR